MYWYDLFPDRLALEFSRITEAEPDFTLRKTATGLLYWEGAVSDVPNGTNAPPLSFTLWYFASFPATAPAVFSVQIAESEVGHDWHRYLNGAICYVQLSKWQIGTTADEIIQKVRDWYFNYVAKKHGLIDAMPDIGRANITVKKTDDETLNR
jgi:hypothetical protein